MKLDQNYFALTILVFRDNYLTIAEAGIGKNKLQKTKPNRHKAIALFCSPNQKDPLLKLTKLN